MAANMQALVADVTMAIDKVGGAKYAVVFPIAIQPEAQQPPRHRDQHQLNRLEQELLCRFRGVVTSLRATGWRRSVVCLYHDSNPHMAAALRPVRDVSTGCDVLLKVPRLLRFDSGPSDGNTSVVHEWYKAHGKVPPPLETKVLQRRTDGPATATKLFALTLTQYDYVLVSDLDVQFLESPLHALLEAHRQHALFIAAHWERGYRSYAGFNSHLMIVKPSTTLFAVLAAQAATGHFIPFTRTEQDVLESTLPLSLGLGGAELRDDEGASSSSSTPSPSSSSKGAASSPSSSSSDSEESPAWHPTTPNVTMPAHLHHFFSGCHAHFCCGGYGQGQRRINRKKCSSIISSERVVGRVLGFGLTSGAGAGASAGAGAASSSSSRSSETVYRVEWVTPQPLGQRIVSTVPLSALCGSSRELIERCHALKWPRVNDLNGSDSAIGRRAERARDAATAWHYIGGERLGCGVDF